MDSPFGISWYGGRMSLMQRLGPYFGGGLRPRVTPVDSHSRDDKFWSGVSLNNLCQILVEIMDVLIREIEDGGHGLQIGDYE